MMGKNEARRRKGLVVVSDSGQTESVRTQWMGRVKEEKSKGKGEPYGRNRWVLN